MVDITMSCPTWIKPKLADVLHSHVCQVGYVKRSLADFVIQSFILTHSTCVILSSLGTIFFKSFIKLGKLFKYWLSERLLNEAVSFIFKYSNPPSQSKTIIVIMLSSYVSATFTLGNLSDTEKKEVIQVLAYLEKFHSNIYFNDGHLSYEDIATKHLLNSWLFILLRICIIF